jgi:hypothetical protein
MNDPQQEFREQRERNRSAVVTVELTIEELDLLATLASDQLFRREFIDPKMPGSRSNPAETRFGKALVERLRTVAAAGGSKKGPVKKNGVHMAPRANGQRTPHAV